jgi:hypothetical protein
LRKGVAGRKARDEEQQPAVDNLEDRRRHDPCMHNGASLLPDLAFHGDPLCPKV